MCWKTDHTIELIITVNAGKNVNTIVSLDAILEIDVDTKRHKKKF